MEKKYILIDIENKKDCTYHDLKLYLKTKNIFSKNNRVV